MRLSSEVKFPFIRFALIFERVFLDIEKEKRELLGSETNRK
jgi:hypothetical protein